MEKGHWNQWKTFFMWKYHSEEVWKGGEKSLNIYNFITNEYLIRNTYCCQLSLCSRTKLLIKCREGNSFSSPKSPYFTIQCLYSIIIVSGKIYYIKHLIKLVFLYSFLVIEKIPQKWWFYSSSITRVENWYFHCLKCTFRAYVPTSDCVLKYPYFNLKFTSHKFLKNCKSFKSVLTKYFHTWIHCFVNDYDR